MAANLGEKRKRIGRRKVADARAGVEERRRHVPQVAMQIQGAREVGDDTEHLDFGEFRGEARKRLVDRRSRDVDGDIAARLEVRQPRRRLAAIAGTEIDELLTGACRERDVLPVFAENRDFGPGRIIFGQFADRAEQRAAQLIVKILGRNRCRSGQQSGDQRVAFGDGIELQAIDDAIIRHGTNRDRLGRSRCVAMLRVSSKCTRE